MNNSFVIKIVCKMHKHRYHPYKYGCKTIETFYRTSDKKIVHCWGWWDGGIGICAFKMIWEPTTAEEMRELESEVKNMY
jgi:hypothetical protein